MKILFLPNYPVHKINKDDPALLSPNKEVAGKPYWFFKYLSNVDIDIIDNKSPFPFNFISKYSRIEVYQALKALIKLKDYDMIISHSFNSGFLLSVIRSFLKIYSPPHIIIDIGCLNGGVDNPYQILILKFALKSVDGLIYHSTINEGFYSKHFNYLRRAFIPFGTDPEFFCPLNYSPASNFALSIGYSKRDYKTLINAWKKIDYPLTIVGFTNIDERAPKMIRLIPRISLDKLKEYIHDSKIVILPIENEPYSVGQMTLMQCMSMKKAIIVNEVPGTRDYLNDNCIAIEYKNEEEIIDKVNLLLDNNELIQKLSNKARHSVLEKFNEKQMAESIYDFICMIKKDHI